MLDASRRVLDLWEEDEFQIFIIQGDNGYGKSSYANKIISEVYSKDGLVRNWDKSLFKKHMGFHPEKVINQWYKMRKRDKCFHWDDAGVWLNAYDYQDPFVKDVAKYLQTARTDWACLIFTCIDKDDVFKKLRSFRASVVIDITKDGAEPKSPEPVRRNRRTAKAYSYWKDRLGNIGTENQWEETFDCYVPNQFYGWYQPVRVKYARMAKKLMRQKAKEKREIKETLEYSDI